MQGDAEDGSTRIRRKELLEFKKQGFDPKPWTIVVGSKKQSKTEETTFRSIVLPSPGASDSATRAAVLLVQLRSERVVIDSAFLTALLLARKQLADHSANNRRLFQRLRGVRV